MSKEVNFVNQKSAGPRKIGTIVASEGKVLVAMPIEDRCLIKEYSLDPKRIIRHRIGGKMYLCYICEIEEEKYDAFNKSYTNDIKAGDKREGRQCRCIIESEVTGRAIVCPDDADHCCYGCPNAGRLDVQTAAVSYLEDLGKNSGDSDDGGDCSFEISIGDVTSETAMSNLERWEIKKRLKDKENLLVDIYEYTYQGYEPKEIASMLKMTYDDIINAKKRMRRVIAAYRKECED